MYVYYVNLHGCMHLCIIVYRPMCVGIRVARCPVFNLIVWYFGSLSGIILIVILDNTCVNSSIVCAKDTGTASARYFGESHLATLSNSNAHFISYANVSHNAIRLRGVCSPESLLTQCYLIPYSFLARGHQI